MSAALDAALSRVDEFTLDNPWKDPASAAVIGAKVKGLMVGYDARWRDAEWVLDGPPEVTVHLPIVNVETGRTSRTFTQAGKYDGIAIGYGKHVLLEHKSVASGEDIADPSSTYWRRLAIDSQVSKYMLQSIQEGRPLDGCLFDVIRKPGIRPKDMAKAAALEILNSGTYCGFQVLPADIEAVRAGNVTESPNLYFLRLAAETLAEPEKYFQRRMIPRLDSDVAEYAVELWQMADEIRLARLSGKHFRNPSACMEFSRACEYLPICSGEDTPESDRWTRAENVHGELDGIADGRDVLTNSRLKVFQSCRRKHYLRYELGVRRVHDEEAESLYLGKALHEGLAQWWAEQKGETHGSTTVAGSAAIEAAGLDAASV